MGVPICVGAAVVIALDPLDVGDSHTCRTLGMCRDTNRRNMRVLQLTIHAVIAIGGLLVPNRCPESARYLVRQIALDRIQQRWITMSGTDFFDNSPCSETAHESPPCAGP
ncbi:MAG: hypothetical protein EOP24_44175 [Hyphomicrobiales bacterium]|nr:MAG: hypothetical protein EOP24_44175 [Hyphomicrobiales bacterium]